jgi:hypothetical protein
MKRLILPLLFLLAVVFAVPVSVTAQGQDSWIGTWRLNLAKSKYEPANLAPKNQVIKQEAVAGGGLKSTVDGVDAQGKPIHTEVTTMFDSKPSEVKDAPDANTTRVYKRIDGRTYEYVQTVAGKPTTTVRSVVAADGKTRTVTTSGKNAQGQTIANVAFFDRQ